MIKSITTYYQSHRIEVFETGIIKITHEPMMFLFDTNLNYEAGMNWAKRWAREVARNE